MAIVLIRLSLINQNIFSFKHEIKAFVDITNDEVYSSESFYSKSRFDKILYLSNELKIIERKL